MKRENVTPLSVTHGNKILRWFFELDGEKVEYGSTNNFLDYGRKITTKDGHTVAIVSIHFYKCKLDSIMITYMADNFYTAIYDFDEMVKCSAI